MNVSNPKMFKTLGWENVLQSTFRAVSWPAHEGNIDRSVAQTQNTNYFFFNGKIVIKMQPTKYAWGWCPIARSYLPFCNDTRVETK